MWLLHPAPAEHFQPENTYEDIMDPGLLPWGSGKASCKLEYLRRMLFSCMSTVAETENVPWT